MFIQLLLVLVILVLVVVLYKTRNDRNLLVEQLKQTLSKKQSLSTKYGQMTEQFMPFLDNYPYNPQKFRFIGSPVDGVQFEDDKVVLIEFKTSNSKLTAKQRKIKDLAKNKKIDFKEVRID